MDVNNEEIIWEDYMLKVDALVTYGYSMPHDIQLRAVYTLNQQVIKWKQRLVEKTVNVICGDDDDNAGGNIDYDDVMPILPVKLKLESNDSSFSDVICGDDDVNAGCNIDHDDVMPILPVQLESKDSSEMPSKMSKKHYKRKRKRPLQIQTSKSTIGGNTNDKISDEDTFMTLEDNSCETKHPMGNKRSRKRRNRIDVHLESSCPSEKIDVKQEDHSVGKGDGSDDQLANVDKVNDGSDKANYCDICDKTYTAKGNFRKHMLIHQKGSLKCNDCDKTFQSVSGLWLHTKIHYPTEACPHCEHKAPNQSYLKKHIDRVHFRGDSSRKPHICDQCGNRFYTAYALNSHVTTHVRDKQYTCSHCDHATHTEILLAKHIKNMHVDRDPFICNICGARTKFKASMDEHQRRHYDERPFKCTECSHTSISATNLAHHKMIHKERAFQCGVCQKKFVYKSQLNCHSAIHTGEKKFACSHCAYTCNVSSNLNKHMLQVHKIKKLNEAKIIRVNEITVDPPPHPVFSHAHTEAIHHTGGTKTVQQQLSEQPPPHPMFSHAHTETIHHTGESETVQQQLSEQPPPHPVFSDIHTEVIHHSGESGTVQQQLSEQQTTPIYCQVLIRNVKIETDNY